MSRICMKSDSTIAKNHPSTVQYHIFAVKGATFLMLVSMLSTVEGLDYSFTQLLVLKSESGGGVQWHKAEL